MRGWRIAALAGLAAGGFTQRVCAQATYSESFDAIGPRGQPPATGAGPATLVSRGWVFRNQSSPAAQGGYFPGYQWNPPSLWPQPQSGGGYLAIDSQAMGDAPGAREAVWAIMPAAAGQRAGDVLTFYLYDMGGPSSVAMEVRYSPNAGTGTGAGPDDTGDFTQVLATASPPTSGAWTRYQVALPGAGRLAFRYLVSNLCANCGTYTGIDSLSIGAAPAPACHMPPVPSVGQNVVWTRADSPYTVCENISIPAGSSVTIEPGVRVDVQGRTISVAGTLTASGTAAQPITLNDAGGSATRLAMAGGTLSLTHTDVRLIVAHSSGEALRLTNCTMSGVASTGLGAGELFGDVVGSPWAPPFVVVDGCTFIDANVVFPESNLVLRNSTFNNCYVAVDGGYAAITVTNTFTGRPLQVLRLNAMSNIQPMFIDGVHASGMAGGYNGVGGSGAALELLGGNFHIGPNTQLSGSVYPVEIQGGLLPGSAVPSIGNTNNAVFAGNIGTARWANVGVPYVLALTGPAGVLTIDPGVAVEGRPGYSMTFPSAMWLTADGLPEAPIIFRGRNGQSWDGIAPGGDVGIRLDYSEVRDATLGVGVGPILYLQNSLIDHNGTGAFVAQGSWLVAQNTRFENSTTRAIYDDGRVTLDGGNQPNSFVGNGVAIERTGTASLASAIGNWWGDPSGPQHPQNPGGAGDAVTGAGANGVDVFPFLTEAPAPVTPPVVRMVNPGYQFWGVAITPDFYFEPGDRMILRWANRNTPAVSQRVAFSFHGHGPDDFVIDLSPPLPGRQQSVEVTLPVIPPSTNHLDQFIRIISVDAAGREGWDETPIQLSTMEIGGELTITTDLAGQTLRAGAPIPDLNYTGDLSGFPSLEPCIVLEADGALIGGISTGGRGYFATRMPYVSTDTARLAIRASNNANNVRWFFAPTTFAIRHDPRLGLTPPAVALTSPAAGAAFNGGATIPLRWTASAAQGLRSFDIQASYDHGRTYKLVAADLAAADRGFDWTLPASSGIPDVRIRLIARDTRFQNSSSTLAVSIEPGVPSSCGTADFDGDSDVGTDRDIEAFFACLAGSCCATCYEHGADFNNDGDVGTDGDIEAFFRVLAGGQC